MQRPPPSALKRLPASQFHDLKIRKTEMASHSSFRIDCVHQGILSSVNAIIVAAISVCNVFFVGKWVGFVDNLKVL